VRVFVTFNALKEYTEAVGQERVEVTTIVPDGTEPHDFEPKARDLAALAAAQVFVYNGFGMEGWALDAVKAAKNDALILVDTSEGITPITADGGEITGHGQADPHIWLSLTCAQQQVKNITKALVKADPAGKDFYEENSTSFCAQLEALADEYRHKFDSVENKSFVTGHAAFGYLCRDFGLEQNSVEDVFAEGEPTAQQLAGLIDYCRAHKVTTIFAEKLASPQVSETLAQNVGALVKTIYTIESDEDGKTYLERMEENLAAIYDSLN
jgi:zinc transport system substrate-binding protein